MTTHSVYSPLQSEVPPNLPKPTNRHAIPLDMINVDAASRLAGYVASQTQKTVALVLIETDTVFTVQVADRILIGRRDFESNDNLDIDLLMHGGREKGVSRRHA